MRKYLRYAAHVRMDRKGIRHPNRKGNKRSYFAVNWRNWA